MFSNRNKIKLSIFALNLSVLNILSIQPAQALTSGSGYIAVVSDSVLNSAPSAAITALAGINRGTEVFADFATAGVTYAVLGNKTAYDTAIATAIQTKGSSLTLPEVQTQIAVVNSAVVKTALAAINGGTEVFADFATAGVTYAVLGNKAAYDTAIATALQTKGSSLTLTEVQITIGTVNVDAAKTALAAINGGTEVLADFATAGVTSAVPGNKVAYDTAIATAIKTKGSSLTMPEVQTQIAMVNVVTAKTALAAINEGTELLADFATAGVTSAVLANKASYDTAIATAIKTKGSSLTPPEILTQIAAVNSAVVKTALAAINGGTELLADFATAGVTGAVLANKADYDTAIATAITTKGSNLTLPEVRKQITFINATAALAAINRGTELFSNFATAGVTSAVLGNKAAYDTAIATALQTKGSSLTLPEIQVQINVVNSAVVDTALAAINGGTEVFADFGTAGITNSILGNKTAYDTAIATALQKRSSLTLLEVQAQIDVVNSAAAGTALAAINEGTEVFADFVTAGVTKAVLGNKAGYDTAIATTIQTKRSNLTLPEIQTQIDVVNAAAAKTALATINGGTELFTDFATAGVTKAVLGNKAAYDTAIATAIKTKGSNLTLADVQTQIDVVNAAAAATIKTALAAINGGTEVFADFATAGVAYAVVGNKAAYDIAIATAIQIKGSSLTLPEVQKQIAAVNAAVAATALVAINEGTEIFADFATAGVTNSVLENKAGYHTAIATAIQTKGSSLTLPEVQKRIAVVNAAVKTALASINEGTRVFFSDYATAGVSRAVVKNKANYQTAITSAIKTKGSSLTLEEVQIQVDLVNLAAPETALAAINGTTEVFADFETAGVTNAVLGNKDGYRDAIATAIYAKGSSLTLTEVQTQIDVVNSAASLTARVSSLAVINDGTEVFADFATAGVLNSLLENKDGYHAAIATAINTKHFSLTLAEVQTQVDLVNTAAQH